MSKSVAQIINLADVASNPLRPQHLKTDLSDTVGSVVLLQIYASQALQQPTIDPLVIGDAGKDLLPELLRNQGIAKRNAAYVSQTVAPSVVANLTDILAYASMIDAFSDAIVPLLPGLTENPAARTQVLALINQLEFEANRRDNSARDVNTQLSVALDKVQTDRKNFAAAVEAANKLIGSDTGELAKIRREIDETQRKIGGEIAGVVVAALLVTVGGIVIAVGALATLPAGVTGASVILPGIALVATGATGLTAAASFLASDNLKLSALYQKSAALNLTLTLVRAISSQVEALSEATTGVAESTSTLSTQWSGIRQGIASFRSEVTRASDASDVAHIIASLKLAQQDWKSITQQAQTLLSRLVDLTPQDVKDILKTGTAA